MALSDKVVLRFVARSPGFWRPRRAAPSVARIWFLGLWF